MSNSEDEPIASPAASSPARKAANDSVDRASDAGGGSGSGDDLFGDGVSDDDGDEQLSDQPLSEHGLSDDDDNDKADDDDDDDDGERYGDEGRDGRGRREAAATREELVMDVNIFRHRVPKSTDETLQSLRIPSFIKVSPEEYRADTYEPTALELESSLGKNAPSVARFRRDPAGSGALQSNTVIYRWSDGSVTLAVGEEHFEVLTKKLAPPSAIGTVAAAAAASGGKYDELQDAHYYAAAAHLSSNLLLTVGHVTEQYSVRANRSFADDALKQLADRLHAASQSSAKASANMIIRTVRDPELAKKEAEMAEKERERAQRRRDAAAARLDGGGSGRAGWGGGGGGALSINDLEGGASSGRRGAGPSRKRGQAGAPRAKRRRPDYDSDDELPQGVRRNDEYDKGDDFIAPSDEEDEEDEEEEDDEDEEEEDDDDDDDDGGHASRRTKRQKTAEAEDDDEDADADGDADVPVARRNRRHILVDDDDDE